MLLIRTNLLVFFVFIGGFPDVLETNLNLWIWQQQYQAILVWQHSHTENAGTG